MPDFNFPNISTLVNTQIYQLSVNGLTPLEANRSEFPAQTARGNGSKRLDTGSADAPIYNWLGLQVFSSATLIHPETKERFNLLTVMFEVRQTKNIDTVAVTGLNGTIKTYINDGDFEVRIKGMLTTDNANDYPIDDVKKLTDILRQPKAIEVICDYLLLFGIYNLVIMDYTFPQSEGIQNIQTFEITALSDAPIELIEDL
jgi:Domain of unknown function (DUF6046)